VPRYLIERVFSVDENQMPAVGAKSKRLAQEQFPTIVWEHSHVLVDEDGTVRTYCVYEAPDEEIVREHAVALGNHTIRSVWPIAGDVSPADFPL
jgi:Protein of unknown function (DUF4242)